MERGTKRVKHSHGDVEATDKMEDEEKIPANQNLKEIQSLFTFRYPIKIKLLQKAHALRRCIMEKPNWQQKILNEEIASKWRTESTVSDNVMDYVLGMLKFMSTDKIDIGQDRNLLGGGTCYATQVEHVWSSDDLIPQEIRAKLRRHIEDLRSENEDDWHPNSGAKVLDIIHPSLFPYVVGTSRYNPGARQRTLQEALSCVEPDVNENPPKDDDNPPRSLYNFFSMTSQEPPEPDLLDGREVTGWELLIKRWRMMGAGKIEVHKKKTERGGLGYLSANRSDKFQWLPAEVFVEKNGVVHFESYINGLHAEHKDVYCDVLEPILSRFIPMFNEVLSELHFDQTRKGAGYFCYPLFGPNSYSDWENLVVSGQERDSGQVPDDSGSDSDSGPYQDTRKFADIVLPEYEPKDYRTMRAVDLRGHNIQVIVKVSEIHLTPEMPTYDGGAWHIEGMENEEIVATGIYYFESENISESTLSFREAYDDAMHYEQNDNNAVKEVYDIVSGEEGNIELGKVVTNHSNDNAATATFVPSQNFEGRCLCWPNTLQHRVEPFGLKDPTKPGRRKILVFFLINPGRRIKSTAEVPPQRWTVLSKYIGEIIYGVCGDKDVVSLLLEFSRWTMTIDEAHQHRLKLMDERKFYTKKDNVNRFERIIQLCEH